MKKTWLLSSMILPICIFTACSDDNDDNGSVDTTPVSLYSGDSKKIDMTIEPATIVAENDFIVDVIMDGTINAQHVGKTNVVVDDRYVIPVEVKGKITTYDDPITEWGCSASYIRKNQKQGNFQADSEEGQLIYKNCGKAEMVMYMTEGDKLTGVGVLIKSQYASEMGNFLTERYQMIPYDIGDYTIAGFDAYELEDAKTLVAIQVASVQYLSVVYLPCDEDILKNKSFSNQDDMIRRLDEVVNKMRLK